MECTILSTKVYYFIFAHFEASEGLRHREEGRETVGRTFSESDGRRYRLEGLLVEQRNDISVQMWGVRLGPIARSLGWNSLLPTFSFQTVQI